MRKEVLTWRGYKQCEMYMQGEFYLQFCGMDHLYSKRGNLFLPIYGLLFQIGINRTAHYKALLQLWNMINSSISSPWGINLKIDHYISLMKEGNVLFNNTLNTLKLFFYGYMASGLWYRTIQIVREETRCHHYMS